MTKIARSGAEGNTRLLAKYGGGSEPPRQSYAKGYATGGIVKGDNPALAEGMGVAGAPAKMSTSRPGRKMPGRVGKGKDAKKAGTNVNVIIVPKSDDKGMPLAMKDAGGPPMPPPGPMAGPGGPGGPPLPMHKHGGRVHGDAAKDKAATKAAVHKHEKAMHPGKPMTKLAAGGPALTGFDAGAGGGKGRLEKVKKYGE